MCWPMSSIISDQVFKQGLPCRNAVQASTAQAAMEDVNCLYDGANMESPWPRHTMKT
jgi:hypothetical protein